MVQVGVDPGLYSRELMSHAKKAATTCEPGAPRTCLLPLEPPACLKSASMGACTGCRPAPTHLPPACPGPVP